MITGRMPRPRLPEHIVERIRRERYEPRFSQCDYLHLRDLRDALVTALAGIRLPSGPALDLYCGTQPYQAMLPARRIVGLDIDRHFGRTDVVGSVPMPFRDGAFALVLCTQALHLVDEPATAVQEMRRVLGRGGCAVITIPHVLRRELAAERKFSKQQLLALFDGWDVEVTGFGGMGSVLAYLPGSIVNGAARRWPVLRIVLPVVGNLLNTLGELADRLLTRMGRRWPASWLVLATVPPD